MAFQVLKGYPLQTSRVFVADLKVDEAVTIAMTGLGLGATRHGVETSAQ
jgi:hypothetical protein